MLPVAAVKIVKRFDRYLFKCKWRSSGGAYGYVDMGGWIGGQAEYVMVPYADFNLLKFPKEQAMERY
jgi:threonine dehydrogenase-like Zn-dependent dehydrogenase